MVGRVGIGTVDNPTGELQHIFDAVMQGRVGDHVQDFLPGNPADLGAFGAGAKISSGFLSQEGEDDLGGRVFVGLQVGVDAGQFANGNRDAGLFFDLALETGDQILAHLHLPTGDLPTSLAVAHEQDLPDFIGDQSAGCDDMGRIAHGCYPAQKSKLNRMAKTPISKTLAIVQARSKASDLPQRAVTRNRTGAAMA